MVVVVGTEGMDTDTEVMGKGIRRTINPAAMAAMEATTVAVGMVGINRPTLLTDTALGMAMAVAMVGMVAVVAVVTEVGGKNGAGGQKPSDFQLQIRFRFIKLRCDVEMKQTGTSNRNLNKPISFPLISTGLPQSQKQEANGK